MDGADDRWVSSRERSVRRALAHPFRESAKFGIAYFGTWITLQLLHGQPVVATFIRYSVSGAIFTVILGLSMRGGWLRRNYERRLDRLVQLRTSPPTAWYPDPSGRHEFRFWDGARWTDFALDNGVQCADPLPEP
jgi:hypothetical protein